MSDYSGKTVFLGIDVHKKTYTMTAICEGRITKRATITADPSQLVQFCKKFFPGAEVETAYEAGFCGFYLHRQLASHKINSRVIHPAGIEIAANDRVKTDKRDSLKIATQLSVGRLKGIYVPTEERERYRTLTRLREGFIRQRSRFAAQMKSLLSLHGMMRHDDDQKVSKKWATELLKKEMPFEIKYAIEQYVGLWLEMTKRIEEVDEQLEKQAGEDSALEKVYMSVPGIGRVAGRLLANELGDMMQFSNERKLFSYVGLTPCEYSSGEHVYLGHISRQGKGNIRRMLIQAAWVAIREDKVLKEVYERISIKRGGKRAIVAVARRLVGHIRACIRKGELYGENKEEEKLGDFGSAKASE